MQTEYLSPAIEPLSCKSSDVTEDVKSAHRTDIARVYYQAD